MGIVTYLVGDNLHICNPIRLKTNVKPTEHNPDLLSATPATTSAEFIWEDGNIKENAIYFQVVSDSLGNLISGTYTFDKNFQFYNLSNVVLNITTGNPTLSPNTKYNITLMAVSADNWVYLVAEKTFYTN